MAEATKSLQKRDVVGSEYMFTYELTNLANAETITTPLRVINSWGGVNQTTADKSFGASVSAGVMTAVVSTTTDEYRVWAKGRY